MAANSTGEETTMIPWLHFAGGDHLFFKSWAPTSPGAIAGACIALAALALFERWLAATRGIMEAHWKRSAVVTISRQDSGNLYSLPKEKEIDEEVDVRVVSGSTSTSRTVIRPGSRLIAPFVPSHDIPRGAIHALQTLLVYLLMLAVMTFQAGYIISILLALGIGEILFGRMGYAQS